MTADGVRAALRAAGVEPAGVEIRDLPCWGEVRRRRVRAYDVAAVEVAMAARRPPPGLDQQHLARALGKSTQSIRNWTREGLPVERIGPHRRYDLPACQAWLAARPKRQARGRTLNGGNRQPARVARRRAAPTGPVARRRPPARRVHVDAAARGR